MGKRIAFLLGAGCEGAGQLGLPSGKTFKRDTIVATGVKELIYALNDDEGQKINNGTIITHNSYGILTQTILERGMDWLTLSDKKKDDIEAYIQIQTGARDASDDEKKRIRENYAQIYKEDFYDVIKKSAFDVTRLDPYVQFFLDNACFYSFVDSLFNCLRKPDHYKAEVNRIVKLYYAAFLSVINGIFNDSEKGQYKEITSKKFTVTEARVRFETLLSNAQRRIYEEKQSSDELYYNIIREYINLHKDNQTGIITTNYTAFAQTFTGIDDEHISYLHGRLDRFESVKSKQAGSLTHFSENEFVFPFIFIQSGVKPVVNGTQIHEYEKAVDMFENADELLILGYGINSDDEHISNFLRKRLQDGKPIKCFLYENTADNQMNIQTELQNNTLISFEDASAFGYALKTI